MKYFRIINIILSLFLALIFLNLLIDIINNPSIYIKVYHINKYDGKWYLKSIDNFKMKHIVNIVIFFSIFIVGVLDLLRKNSKRLRVLCLISSVYLFFWISYHLLMFFTDGYNI